MNSVYYGVAIISFVYFLLYLSSIIRNFATILNVKVLSINPPPEENILKSEKGLDGSMKKNLFPSEENDDQEKKTNISGEEKV